jgi:hypothetical protein
VWNMRGETGSWNFKISGVPSSFQVFQRNILLEYEFRARTRAQNVHETLPPSSGCEEHGLKSISLVFLKIRHVMNPYAENLHTSLVHKHTSPVHKK